MSMYISSSFVGSLINTSFLTKKDMEMMYLSDKKYMVQWNWNIWSKCRNFDENMVGYG